MLIDTIDGDPWLYTTYHLRHILHKEAQIRHFGRYSDAKTAVYYIRSRSFKVIDFGTNRNCIYTFLLVINNNFSHILHRFVDMAA